MHFKNKRLFCIHFNCMLMWFFESFLDGWQRSNPALRKHLQEAQWGAAERRKSTASEKHRSATTLKPLKTEVISFDRTKVQHSRWTTSIHVDVI